MEITCELCLDDRELSAYERDGRRVHLSTRCGMCSEELTWHAAKHPHECRLIDRPCRGFSLVIDESFEA